MAVPTIINKSEYVNFPGYYSSQTGEHNADTWMLESGVSFAFHNTGDYYNLTNCFPGKTAEEYATYYHNKYAAGEMVNCAHFYVDATTICQMIPTNMASWATCNVENNRQYLSVEICDNAGSVDMTTEDFEQAEENAFWYLAKYIKENEAMNEQTITQIVLHADRCATECPKRSNSVHGGADNMRQYIKNKVLFYYENPEEEPIKSDTDNIVESSSLSKYDVAVQLVPKYKSNNLTTFDSALGYLEQGDQIITKAAPNGLNDGCDWLHVTDVINSRDGSKYPVDYYITIQEIDLEMELHTGNLNVILNDQFINYKVIADYVSKYEKAGFLSSKDSGFGFLEEDDIIFGQEVIFSSTDLTYNEVPDPDFTWICVEKVQNNGQGVIYDASLPKECTSDGEPKQVYYVTFEEVNVTTNTPVDSDNLLEINNNNMNYLVLADFMTKYTAPTLEARAPDLGYLEKNSIFYGEQVLDGNIDEFDWLHVKKVKDIKTEMVVVTDYYVTLQGVNVSINQPDGTMNVKRFVN